MQKKSQLKYYEENPFGGVEVIASKEHKTPEYYGYCVVMQSVKARKTQYFAKEDGHLTVIDDFAEI